MFLAHFLQAAGGLELEVKSTPQDCITELIIWNLKPLVVSRMHYWTDYLKLEAASRFKNAMMNWFIFEYWIRSFDPRILLTGFVSEKSIHYCILEKTSRFETY